MDRSLLLVVLLLVLGATPAILRRRRSSTPEGLRVVGRTALARNTVVAVLAVGDRRLLVGSGEHGVTVLAELARDTGAAAWPDPTPRCSTTMPEADGRTDALVDTVLPPPVSAPAERPSAGPPSRGDATVEPRIGLVDRLRERTVRTPVQGRPIDVLLGR